MKKISVLYFLFSTSLLIAQVASNHQLTLEEKFKLQYEKDRSLAEAMVAGKHISLKKTDMNGRHIEFSGFDYRGRMQFNITDNVGAGRTISTNKVWPGGSVGTSLTGLMTGNRLGVWDGGAVRTSHQEFGGRATQADGSPAFSDHATHVSCTMIGAGVSANAKGMAYAASIRAYDWSNDASEMSAAAAAGMLVSNHSYGNLTGWYYDGSTSIWYGDPSISNIEDWRFGFYDQTSANWDNIVVANPYYLICKSAGNDRGDTKSTTNWEYANGDPGSGTPPPADGQYDCISTYSGAKNILTVGAVRKIGNSNTNNGWTKVSDVVMSTFSGWGPVDDGRIKPDVVGCGVSVYSATAVSNTSYDTYQGTSMATPNVSGSLLLVQQHYQSLKSTFMRASTLKGLTIHTADEAGNNGPDYQYGWGLVNTAKAVQVISDSNTNQIQELVLTNGKSMTQSISSAGILPLKITICWTDPAGTPVGAQLDPSTRMLVNDLDIRLIRTSDNATFYPYILSKDTPTAVARTGDNIVDNVEQIYLATPQAGSYQVKVTHKGNLVGNQYYSLIISGLMTVPVAIINANNRSICTGQSVTFTDQSSGSPTSRQWYFPGGTPASSTSATLNVSYATAGKFPVILVVSNALGKDSLYSVNYITAGGSSLPFLETFESNSATLASWSVVNPNSDTTWRLANIGGTSPGNKAYCMPFYNYNTAGRRDGLLTPALNFKGFSAVSLTFAHAYAHAGSGASDSLTIWVSTNCGSSWTQVASIGENGTNNFMTVPYQTSEFLPATSAHWCSNNCITINLNAYAGLHNVKIKFEGYNQYNNNLYIDNVNITGVPLVPVPNFFASKRNVCMNEPVNFFDSTVNQVSTWEWTFTGAQTTQSNLQNPTGIRYPNAGTYAVKLKATNASGSDSITKSAYITVVANPAKPSVSNNRPLSFCSGDSTQLICDSAATGYQWWRSGIKLGGATAQQLFVFESGQYRVEVSNAGGCKSFSDSVGVFSNTYPAKPGITSNLSGNFMCTGGTATLTSSAPSGNQWYRNLIPIANATGTNYATQDSGNYTVQVSNNGCLSPMSDTRSIALLASPVTSDISGVTSSVRNKIETYAVTNTVGSSYNWSITGGVKISGANTSSIQVQWTTAGTGTVTVQETASNGCKGTLKSAQINISNNTALDEEDMPGAYRLVPNPSSGRVAIQGYFVSGEEIRIQMFNLLGQMVHEENKVIANQMHELPVQLKDLEPGIYLCSIVNKQGSTLLRLIME